MGSSSGTLEFYRKNLGRGREGEEEDCKRSVKFLVLIFGFNDDDEGERFFGDCFKERLSLVDTIVVFSVWI